MHPLSHQSLASGFARRSCPRSWCLSATGSPSPGSGSGLSGRRVRLASGQADTERRIWLISEISMSSYVNVSSSCILRSCSQNLFREAWLRQRRYEFLHIHTQPPPPYAITHFSSFSFHKLCPSSPLHGEGNKWWSVYFAIP